ncbi:dimethylamine monooxygenase subunit DmmA family protein [Neptuniibacter halophilus]|uniref:dimethylamine monooxygenase subunit DmmA family protein n=1 Tax=Neptuniibacter halophilus TaxID=651666 RepID=UPI0025726839|nr:dimethylamine monooxygenase subunit DmmA family protein [Neptuniibacter halophilus]
MQPEDISAVMSRPVYQPVVKNSRAARHLFIVQAQMTEELALAFESCREEQRSLLTLADQAEVETRLNGQISELPLSSMVYVAGDEAYLWGVFEYLRSAGMLAEQIRLSQPVVSARQIFCCHCYSITGGVTRSPAVCVGCQRHLAVTDHFARKHGAYFAYQANAEDPQDLPEQMELS